MSMQILVSFRMLKESECLFEEVFMCVRRWEVNQNKVDPSNNLYKILL